MRRYSRNWDRDTRAPKVVSPEKVKAQEEWRLSCLEHRLANSYFDGVNLQELSRLVTSINLTISNMAKYLSTKYEGFLYGLTFAVKEQELATSAIPVTQADITIDSVKHDKPQGRQPGRKQMHKRRYM